LEDLEKSEEKFRTFRGLMHPKALRILTYESMIGTWLLIKSFDSTPFGNRFLLNLFESLFEQEAQP